MKEQKSKKELYLAVRDKNRGIKDDSSTQNQQGVLSQCRHFKGQPLKDEPTNSRTELPDNIFLG